MVSRQGWGPGQFLDIHFWSVIESSVRMNASASYMSDIEFHKDLPDPDCFVFHSTQVWMSKLVAER